MAFFVAPLYQRFSNSYACGKLVKNADSWAVSKNSDSEVLGRPQEFAFQTNAPGKSHTGDLGITLWETLPRSKLSFSV